MKGIVKKMDAQGFGIIDGADGSKVPFILSDVKTERHRAGKTDSPCATARRNHPWVFVEGVVVRIGAFCA